MQFKKRKKRMARYGKRGLQAMVVLTLIAIAKKTYDRITRFDYEEPLGL
jgi:hypothetical protein